MDEEHSTCVLNKACAHGRQTMLVCIELQALEIFVKELGELVTSCVPDGCSEEDVKEALKVWWHLDDIDLATYKRKAGIQKDAAVKCGASLWRSITMDVVNKTASGRKAVLSKTAIRNSTCRPFLEAKTWVS